MIDIFLRPSGVRGYLWIGCFTLSLKDEAREFSVRNRSKGAVFTRLRRPRRSVH